MRLSDELAAQRRFYAMPLITAPSVMVIDIPQNLAGAGLALGRYYIVIVEANEELAEFEAFLAADRVAMRPPDLLDRRPSRREAGAIGFFEFAPPEPGWPWILLCHWPRNFTGLFDTDPSALARGAYSMEAFQDRDALQSMLKAHIAVFGDLASVRTVPSLSGVVGRA
ncbi:MULTISPECIES: hypothetical protein [Sphingomonadales]|uniref:Uncharacterized protein n=2 Tax=Sphingomonadaceae TaxID=41297 RepID=A0A397PIQ6_9SPHN|nr:MULTISPECIES: hypothetical protein [Sphingomonadaceae]EKU73348.1 hypothetical protein HMPREF9718_03817 [Sphingobium yanoikuyae ATCC 51230]RIA46024.1 hypothetical protein DFR49_0553 [Hephaestia caeni]WQE08131.1 hypothetical protein U0025_04390 [Sphingobium yanoikuyae]